LQAVIVLAFVALVAFSWQWAYHGGAVQMPLQPADRVQNTPATTPIAPEEAARCKVPDFAKAMGHEEKWKLHNHCK
jgi:hypothetical protein